MKRREQGIREMVNARLKELGHNQEWLGASMARILRRPEPFAQTTVSSWLTGSHTMGPEESFAMEKALGYKPGQMTRHLGYVPADARTLGESPEAAIANDTRLNERDRRILLALYGEMLES